MFPSRPSRPLLKLLALAREIAVDAAAQPTNLSLPHDSQLPQVDMLPGDDILDEPRLAALEFLADQVAVIIARGRSETRLREANVVLERERATLTAIMESLTSGFMMIDPNRRVTYCNEPAATIMGVRAEDVIGQLDEVAFRLIQATFPDPAGSLNRWDEVVNTLLTARERRRFEISFRGYHHEEIAAQIYPVEAAGSLLGIGLSMRDVTALKHVALLRERERIAMDLHDGVIQTLYAAALRLEAAKQPPPGDRPATGEVVSGALDLIEAAIRSIRTYVSNLDERSPGQTGIGTRLHVLAEELTFGTSLRPSVEVDNTVEATLAPEAVGHVFQIAHEATTNVVRHARARKVIIRLARLARTVVLTVADDGCGFDPASLAEVSGHGLHNMARRADLVNGRLQVTSQSGKGTEVRLDVPLGA